ncbi:uncharacterized protein TM35_000431800 [Trypanosoma theileri]|uniref:Uncharacterized protein n=1 Tax=Trypanosoma theileri TaxID=67003 RepID=A0A1X0NIP3_9TRYP|nr:uncharacterized protein TM35_000431800 [Trypanosoma theileri]ORC84612.1 hypothetical protein TM35_000431800 [Trypanosoma theileri]
MTTIYQAVETSTLKDRCRIDLLDGAAQLQRHSETLPKRELTVAAADLPQCTFETTISRATKTHYSQDESAMQRFLTEKEANQERTMQASSSTYFKKYNTVFRGALPRSEPFRETRDRNELTGREKDFVHRYAEAAVKKPLEREQVDDTPTKTAREAYKKAFREYKGRDPTEKELEEVGRLWFAYTEDGTVGVVQKPHFHGPHSHVSICNRRYAQCVNQVYKNELPPVRAARSRFPGPIPVWSSTQNTYTMVAGDTYVPGLHNVSKFGSVSF